MYINGLYVGQDFEQGLRHMELAASHGDFRAMYYAGKAYIHGWSRILYNDADIQNIDNFLASRDKCNE